MSEIETLKELCQGQAKTITSLKELVAQQRTALTYWRDECTGNEPSLSVAQRLTDGVMDATPEGMFSVIADALKKAMDKLEAENAKLREQLASVPTPDPEKHSICHACDGRGFIER